MIKIGFERAKNAPLIFENLNLTGLDYQVCKPALVAGRPNDMVINPVVIPSTGFAKHDTVIFESVSVQPLLRDGSVYFCSAGEKVDDMAFIVPLIEFLECIRIWLHETHPFRFFIGHIIANGAVYINEVVFNMVGQDRACTLPIFIKGIMQNGFRCH